MKKNIWKLRVDELCRCEHKRSEHGDTLAIGHGSCNARGCNCKKFSWICFLDKNGNKL